MEFLGDIARKSGDASLLRVEAEKSRLAALVGSNSGLFRVPNILQFDEKSGTLDFERIRSLVTFSSFVSQNFADSNVVELTARAGRALARIHLDLRLNDAMQHPLPNDWMTSLAENVFIHGDLTANNICVDESDMSLVVVDWSAAPMVGRRATLGPRGFDVICFVRHLHFAAPWAKTLNWPAPSLSDCFMRSYVEEYGTPLDASTWRQHQLEMNRISTEAVEAIVQAAPISVRHAKALAQKLLLRRWLRYSPPAECLTK
jgi:tRNA A-37 threonylcarbamoyl transferase component Bud32